MKIEFVMLVLASYVGMSVGACVCVCVCGCVCVYVCVEDALYMFPIRLVNRDITL